MQFSAIRMCWTLDPDKKGISEHFLEAKKKNTKLLVSQNQRLHYSNLITDNLEVIITDPNTNHFQKDSMLSPSIWVGFSNESFRQATSHLTAPWQLLHSSQLGAQSFANPTCVVKGGDGRQTLSNTFGLRTQNQNPWDFLGPSML